MFFYYKLLAGVLLCLFVVSCNLLINKHQKNICKDFLGVGLLGLVWFIFIFIYYIPQNPFDYSFLFWLGMPVYYLSAPLFYLCVVYKINGIKRLRRGDLLHLLPILLVVIFFAGSNFYDTLRKTNQGALIPGLGLTKVAHIYFLHIIQMGIYLYFQWNAIYSARHTVFADKKDKLTIVLSVVLSLLLVGYVCIAVHLFYADHNVLGLGKISAVEGNLIITIISLAVFCFYFFYHTDIFGASAPQLDVTEASVGTESIKINAQYPYIDEVDANPIEWLPSDLTLEECCQKLEHHMRTEKPWLQKRLTIQTVASSLNISPHLLSALINKHYMINYNDFINQYRIQHIEEMIRNNSRWKTLTLEAVAQEAGFSSRTACYNAFKKNTGMSLGNYIEAVLADTE